MKLDKKICVIGGGNWGKNHINTLNKLGFLGGIVDSSELLINSYKISYPNCEYFMDIEDSFNSSFDGYIISTPPATHYEIAKKIISKGKPVLVEKPFTLNLKDAEDLNQYAKLKRVNIYVGHLLLFHPAYLKIKELIEDDLIGDIQYIYSNRLNLGTIRKDENVFWSFAPHDIALIQFFLRSFPTNVLSNGAAIIRKNVHDTTITTLKYPNNVMCHIFVSWLHPYKEHKFIIVGSKGMISFEDSHKDKPLIYHDKRVDWVDGETIPSSGKARLINYGKDLALDNQLKYFVKTLDDFKVEKINGDSAVEVIKILEKANLSLLN
tara:strand:+ start:1638 stop:2603 length:966 start_codon:yes stop_codon:yes gene_type:complete